MTHPCLTPVLTPKPRYTRRQLVPMQTCYHAAVVTFLYISPDILESTFHSVKRFSQIDESHLKVFILFLCAFPESVVLRISYVQSPESPETTLRFRKGFFSNRERRHARMCAKIFPEVKQGYASIIVTFSLIAFPENGDNQSITKIAGDYFLLPESRKQDMQFFNESWASRLVCIGYHMRDEVISVLS